MSPPTFILGAYGKLPTHGDFLRRGLRGETISAYDAWLQRCLSACPADWLIEAAEPWRFLASPGVFGRYGLTGVMAASCDQVGRQFPLTIALEFEPYDGATAPCLEESGWVKIEGIVQLLCQGGPDAPSLDQALAELTGFEDPDTRVLVDLPEGCSIWWRGAEPVARVEVGSAPDAGTFSCMMDGWARTTAAGDLQDTPNSGAN